MRNALLMFVLFYIFRQNIIQKRAEQRTSYAYGNIKRATLKSALSPASSTNDNIKKSRPQHCRFRYRRSDRKYEIENT